jgi:hypothetical protein
VSRPQLVRGVEAPGLLSAIAVSDPEFEAIVAEIKKRIGEE